MLDGAFVIGLERCGLCSAVLCTWDDDLWGVLEEAVAKVSVPSLPKTNVSGRSSLGGDCSSHGVGVIPNMVWYDHHDDMIISPQIILGVMI